MRAGSKFAVVQFWHNGVEATEMTGERLALSFSLAGFARVNDGPEPKVFE